MMTMVHHSLLFLAILFACDAASSLNSTQYLRVSREEEKDYDEEIQAFRRSRQLFPEVEEKVLTRYKSVPEGYRKFPSYYSEIYLPRARATMTATEKEDLAKEWGSWTFVDPKPESRPDNDFYNQYPNRDVPFADFPDTAWQKDKSYLEKFLPEGIALTERAMEAMLSEYGRGKKDMPESDFEERSAFFKINVDEAFKTAGGGWMPPASWDGLKQRILHALVTEDRFTVAMGGHSAAAGHGNHFMQSYTLQIGRILEPIFARLGVKASARNFGMGGLGTLQNGVGAGDIYGRDVDVLLWDSSMTERSTEMKGIFCLQALLAIDRAPLLWFANAGEPITSMYNLAGADIAVFGSGDRSFFKQVATIEELKAIPYAAQYFCCSNELNQLPECQRYDGRCWVDRSDFVWEGMNMSWTPLQKQDAAPGGRAGWHPGNREHQLTGRSITFPIIKALHDVLTTWNAAPDYALEDSAWHVTAKYKGIKDKVVENKVTFEKWCEERKIPLKFCLYPAHARTEFTPRAHAWKTSLRSIMSGSEHTNYLNLKNDYDPPEAYNPSLDPPEGEVDALAIIENGIKYHKNLARVYDSAQDMLGTTFTEDGTGSKHNPDIKGGKGWTVSDAGNAGTDNCDGEYDSWCHREGGCLLIAHNDGRHGLLFDGFSGWMIFSIPKLNSGVVMLKFHTWMFSPPKATEGWCSENNVEPCAGRALRSNSIEEPSNPMNRELKPAVPAYCDDWKFEFAIDGKITSWDVATFEEHRNQADRVVEFVTILDDDTWEGPKDVEVVIRMTGCGRQKPFALTHIYWI